MFLLPNLIEYSITASLVLSHPFISSEDLKTVGTQFDVRHYNALLKVYLENGHPFDPEDFLLIISEDGIEMNEETYSLFVQRYCQTGNVGDAMRTLEFMKS